MEDKKNKECKECLECGADMGTTPDNYCDPCLGFLAADGNHLPFLPSSPDELETNLFGVQ